MKKTFADSSSERELDAFATKVSTTKGDYNLHDFLTGDESKPWTIMFSHPNDFTPVCTTELGACHTLSGRFAAMGAKLIGISCNTVDSHVAWTADVLAREGTPRGRKGGETSAN